MVKAIKNIITKQGDLTIRRVRFSRWNVVFLFAAAIILGDLRLVELGDQFMLFDSLTIEVMGYAVGILVYVFIKGHRILSIGKIGAVLAMASIIASDLTPQSAQLAVYTIYAFAGGLCIGCGIFVFFCALNNTERLFNLIIIQLYFAVCVFGLWSNSAARTFLSDVFVYILITFFIIAIFTIRKAGFPSREDPKEGGCGSEDNCCRVGKSGMGILFYVYIIFMAISALNFFIVRKEEAVNHAAYSIGAIIAIILALVIMVVAGKSALWTWKIFLVGSLGSLALLAVESMFDAKTGSLFYGVAHTLGFIAIFYLLGGAGRLTGCLKFFRIFCLIEFLISFILNPAIEYVFVGVEAQNHVIALYLMIGIVCATLLLYPVIHKKIFESDWIEDTNLYKQKQLDKNPDEEADMLAKELGLTPREGQIFKLMLTDLSVKQIMIDLEISKGTFNFHSLNIYRKLDIQSRAELFVKFGSAETPEKPA